jgi:uncharacterized SAM-binding protein YcdF (DUF218 family)
MNIGSILEQIILPPGGLIFLSMLGLLLMRKRPRVGFYMTASGLALLYIACLPVTSHVLLSWLEPDTALTENALLKPVEVKQGIKSPQAIVILGAGRHYNTLEFNGDTPNALALERVRYGVWLARRTLLPVLVSGGLAEDNNLPEAEMLKQIIEEEYALPVRWVEKQSGNTYENAKYTSQMLAAEGIVSIYLVTHAGHMKRSLKSFEKFGLTVFPAPTAFDGTSQRSLSLNSFLPSSKALGRTAYVFHEWAGIVWYGLRD